MGKIIGIDLNCHKLMCQRCHLKAASKVITNEESARTTSSVVAWDNEGEVLDWSGCPASGDHQRKHGVQCETLHRLPVRRSGGRSGPFTLQGR